MKHDELCEMADEMGEPTLELQQARTHAAQLIIAAIEKQGTLSVPAMIRLLERIGEGDHAPRIFVDGHPDRCDCPVCTPPKLSTYWEN